MGAIKSSANALRSATTRVDVSAATAPSSGQVLTATGTTAATWQTPTAAFSPTTRFSTVFETQGRFTITLSSGTATFGTQGLVLDTTATGGRTAKVNIPSPSSGNNWFLGSPMMSATFGLDVLGTTAKGAIVAGADVDPTQDHFGFKILVAAGVASLYATQADGTTETASSALTTIATSDLVDVCAKMNGTSSIDYYWRKNGGSWSSATNLTGNMPSSTNEQNATCQVANTTGQFQMQVLNYTYER